ncbi:Tetrahydrofolate synthase [Bertholletia excelsa]
MSSQIQETLGSKVVNKEKLQDFPLSSTYEMTMEALSSLITRQKRGDKSPILSKYDKLERMSMYIKILGLEEDIAGLKIIHVAGTKGKGSTCAFCEAILRECGFKTGLFISPHLIDIRERFRVDGLDISEDKFLLYFWDVWNQLKGHVTEDLPMPPLFQFLTILAFKIFICEKVDVAIIEVGLGGTMDATNVIKEPVVCGITSLGMDHTETLGDTLGKIASHKAGIFKPQVPAFTASQLPEAMDVIQERARELKIPLEEVAPLDHKKLGGLKLSLSGDHQFINGGLAVSLCKSWLRSTGNWEKTFQNGGQEDGLPAAFLRGLSTAQLSGRAQIIFDSSVKPKSFSEMEANSSGNLIFYLDGAHSPESMEVCAKWFSNAVKVNVNQSPPSSSFEIRNTEELQRNGCTQHVRGEESDKISKQILLFNCMEMREPHILLPRLVTTCASAGVHFSKAIFVPSMSIYNKVTSAASVIPPDTTVRDLSWQFSIQRIWEKIIHGKDVVLDKGSNIENVQSLPPCEFLHEDVSHCNPRDRYFTCSTVFSSLPLTINWLRDCARENPSLRIQVLVTGSIHLVGDVLKLIRR